MSDPASIALHRYGLGPRPGEYASVAGDPRGWLLAQLGAKAPSPPELAGLPPLAEALKLLPRFLRKERKEGRQAAKSGDGQGTEERYREVMQAHFLAEAWGRHQAAVNSTTPFRERLVRFWANHFTVSGSKPQTLPLAGVYEREAIRPHIGGRYVDLLRAAALHPAMLSYLDNDRSVGPGSRAGLRREQGLNENLAREILELHTLGVGGGYHQADVTAFARVLTGHGIDYAVYKLGEGGYRYYPERHEPGAQTLLGKIYPDKGPDQAGAVFEDLARHPATARHIAGKLARHFIADEPPDSAVARLEQSFLTSGGDLGTVSKTLVELPEAWQAPPSKFLSPDDWLVACDRLLAQQGGLREPRQLMGALQQLGQPAFRAPSPAGWPDLSAAWLTADALWKRLEIAVALANSAGVDQPLRLAEQTLGRLLSEASRDSLRGAESAAQGLALLLVAPEFNRR